MKAAVVKETSPGERRVALVPDAVPRLRPAGIDVLVESGAGDAAWLSDAAYADAGASIVSAAEIYRTADVILTVTRPSAEAVSELRAGQAVIGMLAPLADPDFAAALAARDSVRGSPSRLITVTPWAARVAASSGSASGASMPMTAWPALSSATASGRGRVTVRITSAVR